MWGKLPEYTEEASKLGAVTNDLYAATTLYYQQGLDTNEVIDVSTETLKMARIAGMDYADATNYMTAALRGFNMEINETNAQRINDVYSKLKEFYKMLPPLGYDSLYLNFTDMAKRWGKEYNREKLEGFIKRANQDLENAQNEDSEIDKIDDLMKNDKQYENLVLERKKAEQAIDDNTEKRTSIVEELTKQRGLGYMSKW